MNKYFVVNVNKYVLEHDFSVYYPASLDYPKDNAVMFIMENFMKYADSLLKCRSCLVFWPQNVQIPDEIEKHHAIYKCENPRREYARFFRDNGITYLPENIEYESVNGAFISKEASIGKDVQIFPGAYIGEALIGNNVYIGSGVRLIGKVIIGNNVIIRENTVIGADGLTTQRDENGKTMMIPQFGGTVIEDDVQIGALTTIARGAIDNTIIHRGTKIDNCCFISHNTEIGEDTYIVGETIMFGSTSTGVQSYISGNVTVRDGVHIGAYAKVGMGAVVTKDVEEGCIVKGNPAR